jgi:predicted dithiol-disulfide oxidoreductase (DUF899 family)
MSTATISTPAAGTSDTAHRVVSRDQWLKERIALLAEGNVVYNFTGKPYPVRELPGLSVFFKDARGDVFHTYSTFARGLESFLTAYNYIDLTPKGRDEAEIGGMGWVRHHDRYGDANFVDPWAERPGITAPLPR